MKPKLLVLTSTFPRWQNDTDPPFVYELSRRLTGTFDVIVHAPHYPGAKIRERMDGMRIHRFRYFFASFEKLAGSTGMLPTLHNNKLYYGLVPFFIAAQFFSLLLVVRKLQPDIIHAHWLVPQGFLAIVAKKFFDVPVVVTAHGADIFGLQHRIFKKIKEVTVTRANGVTVVSKALSNALAEILPSEIRLEIISMGVDSKEFDLVQKDEGVRKKYGVSDSFLLYVGRLTEKKGVQYLINAMPAVLRRHPHAKLLIVGSGELEGQLQAQVKSFALDRQILFVGSIPNVELPAYYATADVFIGPSIQTEGGDTEGFGLTFVEAAMSGCLVIATETGGIGDIIQDSKTGFLVAEKNPDALAEKIIYVIEHREEMETIRNSARQRCMEKYDWSVIVRHYEIFFKRLFSSA